MHAQRESDHSTNTIDSTTSANFRSHRKLGRIVFLVSALALVLVVFLAGYYGFHRVKLSGPENERLSKLGDEWVLNFDITNPDEVEHTYFIKVKQSGPEQEPWKVLVPGGKQFNFSAHIYPAMIVSDTVTLEVWRDSLDGPPARTSTYYLR